MAIIDYGLIWIPGYGELARPLYKLITETQQLQTQTGLVPRETQKAFKDRQTTVLQHPAFSWPTGSEFTLLLEKKRLQPQSLRVIATIVSLTPKTPKFTVEQSLTVLTSQDEKWDLKTPPPPLELLRTQGVSEPRGTENPLHWSQRPQSSRKAKKADYIIRRHLRKPSQETQDCFVSSLTRSVKEGQIVPKKGLSL